MKLIEYRVKGTEFSVWASVSRAAQIDNGTATIVSGYTTADKDDLMMLPADWLERIVCSQPDPQELSEFDRETIDRLIQEAGAAGLDREARRAVLYAALSIIAERLTPDIHTKTVAVLAQAPWIRDD